MLQQAHKPNLYSLDRRDGKRVNKEAEILTFWDKTRFLNAPVIECSEYGARIVAPDVLAKNDKIGVVVLCQGERIRTIARVAWSSPLSGQKSIVGLEFLNLDMDMDKAS